MISSDPKIQEDSDVAKRIEEYRQLVDELYAVVIAGKLNITAFFRAYWEGSKILRSHGATDFLITAQDPAERWLVGWLLSRKFHVPLEVQVHTDLKSPYLLKESIKNRVRLLIARILLPRVSCVRVVSERIQRSLIKWIPQISSKITVLPIYVDVEKFRVLNHVEEQGVFQFLVVSRLTREKNITLAIDTFAQIHAEFPQTKLTIVGDGPERERLEALVLKHDFAKDAVVFAGWEEDVSRRYQNADCYLLTSNYEGYGRTVIEALAAGVPVIMTDVGVAGDIVENEKTGLVVPVGNILELAKAMRRVINDSGFRRTLSENGRAAANPYFSKERYLQAYKNVWHTCRRYCKCEQEKRIKVCFIIPEKAEDTATHFAHKWEMIKELENTIEFLSYVPNGLDILRIIRTRMRGCSTYYVHYSFKGALLVILITSILGGRVFYWNCGLPWLYKRGWFEELLFRFILRNTILVTGTEGLAEEYANHYGLDKKNIRVVPNYIRVSRMQSITKEHARKELGLPQDKKIVLFLHRLSRRKGVHLLPDIIKEFSDRKDISFVIVGEGPERRYLEEKLTTYNLQLTTHMEGSIPNYRVPYYIAASDIYLMPSEEEGMPNALLEAMAAGVPFVASDVGGVKEMTPSLVQEFVLPYGDTHAFADKIKKLLADEELWKRISLEEKEWVKRYDVSVIAPQFLELFQEAKKVP